MSDDDIDDTGSTSLWTIPDWYRRVGLASWFFIGIAAALTLIAVLIAATSEITAPLALGGFVAIVFLPVADWLTTRGVSRTFASLTVLVGLAILIVAVSWGTGVALMDQADEVTANLDEAVQDIEAWLEDTPINDELIGQIRQTTGDLGPSLNGGLADRLVSLLDSAFGFIAGTILGTIVLYYLLRTAPPCSPARWSANRTSEHGRSTEISATAPSPTSRVTSADGQAWRSSTAQRSGWPQRSWVSRQRASSQSSTSSAPTSRTSVPSSAGPSPY